MKESVAITKEADAKKDFSPTKSGDSSIQRLRDEHERQLGSLRGVIGNIRRDGGTPSVDSIATELSSMPSAQRASALLALQSTHGNRYVQRVVAGIQAKLAVGQPGDTYEQEADRVADEVMRMPEPEVQRQPEEEEELIQTKPPAEQITPLVQRQEELKEEKEEPVMAKEISRRKLQISDDLETCLNLSKGGGYPLPENTRLFMENRLGVDFSQVRVHTDTHAVQMAGALNAEAFTSGRDVYFATGRYNPDSTQGKKLIAHELTHVIQQGWIELQTKNRGYKNRPFYNELDNTKKQKVNLSLVQSKLFTPAPMIQTYGSDVHRDMTETEATGAGFSAGDASIIAAADQAVDSEWTHPWIQTPLEFLNPRVSGRDMLHFPARSVAISEVNAAIGTCNLRNFGRALHRYQDSYSHSFPSGVVSARKIATSPCWVLNPTLAAPILLSHPLYGRMAVLKHVCLLTYPDDYMRNSEQRARDTNMRSGTSRFLATLFRRCASRPTPGDGTAAPSVPSPAATTGATPCRPTFVSLNAVKTGNIGMTTSWGRCELALGTRGSPGMTFRSSVNVPGECTGTLYYLQLIDRCVQRTNASGVNEHIKTNGYVLDTSDPYPSASRRVTSPGTVDFETADSPSGGYANSNTYLYDVDRFKMWLLWRPDSPAGSSRVPLAVVRWNWTARANKTGTRGCASAWTISNDNANGGTGSATSTSPTWSRTYPDDFSYVSGVC